MSDANKKVEEALKKKLKVDFIDPTIELKELGLDSLDVVELLLSFEDEFGIEFASEELKSLKKVEDLYIAIDDKLKK